jgi:hypothetical protein
MPDLVVEEWGVVRERVGTPLEQLALGEDARLCEALLTLHALADEACAGLGIALDTSDAAACVQVHLGRQVASNAASRRAPDAARETALTPHRVGRNRVGAAQSLGL